MEKIEEMQKEINTLKNQMKTHRWFYLVVVLFLIWSTINSHLQYSLILSDYQSAINQGSGILLEQKRLDVQLESLNQEAQAIREKIQELK